MLLTYMFVLVVQPVRKLVWLAMRINGVFGLGLVSRPSIVAEARGAVAGDTPAPARGGGRAAAIDVTPSVSFY
jgi:hypothetical protein